MKESITVGQLKQMLDNEDDNMEVYFAYPFGDYWSNTVAGSITDVRVEPVAWSEYHAMYKLITDGKDCSDYIIKDVLILD